MDEKDMPAATSGTTGSAGGPRSDDPREELRMQLQVMGQAAGDLLNQLVKVPATLAQIPMQMLPEDTATHARNAATEGFAAVRTLLDSMAHGVDELIKTQRERMRPRDADDPAPPAETGGIRALESGTRDLGAAPSAPPMGGHGSGAGPHGSGAGEAGSRDLGANGPTVRLDEEP